MDMDGKNRSLPVISSKQSDFEEIWLRIATDIKIRKFDNLDDIPEFHELPNQLQNQLKSAFTELNDNYKIFYDKQELANYHVILFGKEKDKYLAIYEEQTKVQQMRSIADRIGLRKLCPSGWNFILKGSSEKQTLNNDPQTQQESVEKQTANNDPQTQQESVEKQTANNDPQTQQESVEKQTANNDPQTQPESVEKSDPNNATSSSGWNVLSKVSNIDPWSYIPFYSKSESSTPESPCNKLIEACMLHKLKTISNSQ